MPNLARPIIFLAFAGIAIPGHVDLPRLADEQRRVRAALEPAVRSGRCDLLERSNATLDDILQVFQDDRYSGRVAVFHYAGHADGYSLLVQDGQGKALPAGAGGLAQFLSVQPGLQLVVLNACSTADQVQALHAAGVPAVVATHEEIPDSEWVVAFAETLYRGLTGGKPIAAAFTEAVAARWSAEYALREQQDAAQWELFAVSDAARAWSLPPAPDVPGAGLGQDRLWANVPARPSHTFVGREQTLDDLVDLLTAPQRPVAAVAGLAGCGKTALAVEVVHDPRIAAHFSDGILWGALGTAPDAASILNQWAEALGQDWTGLERSADLRRRRDRLSAAVGTRSVLVVIDDAWDGEIAALLQLSSPNAMHLLTTRSHDIAQTFAGTDRTLALPVLDDEPGFALLQSLAPAACAADPAGARALVQTVGSLPLAIMLLGGYLRSAGARHFARQRARSLAMAAQPATRLALAMQRLGAAGSEVTNEVTLVDAVSLSLHGLPDPVRQAFHALGAFAALPERFELDAALAVTGADEDALGTLIDRNLVEIDAAERMALHQVVADVARAQMPPDAQVRQREYYLALVNENPDDWHRIEAIYGQVKWAWMKAATPENALGFVWPLQSYQKRRGLWQDLLAWLEMALQAAQAAGRQPDVEQLLGSLGLAYHDLGDNRRAIDYLEQALAAARALGNRQAQSIHLGSLGLAYLDLDETATAIVRLQEALAIARASGDRRAEGSHLGSLALVHRRRGAYPEAAAHLRQALVIARAAGDRYGEASHLDNLGLALYDEGKLYSAIACFRRALAIARELGDRRSENHQLGNLGLACQRLGYDAEAATYLEEAVAIAEDINDRRHLSRHLGNLGSLYQRRRQTARAITAYERATAISREIGDRGGESSHLGNLGNLYRNLGQPEDAIGYYQQALAVAQEIGDERAQGRQLGSLGLACYDLDRLPEASRYLEQALAITRRCHDRPGESSHLGSLALVADRMGQSGAAVDHLRQALAVARAIGDRRLEADHLGTLGVVQQHAGRISDAIAAWEDSIRLCRMLGDRRREARVLMHFGDLRSAQGEQQEALVNYEQALTLYGQAGNSTGEAAARRKIAALGEAANQLSQDRGPEQQQTGEDLPA